MRGGRLRHVVELVKPVTTRSARGGDVTTFATVVPRVKAEVVQLSGDELRAAMQTDPEAKWRCRVRRMPSIDINTTWRLVYGEREFAITAAYDPDGMGRELLIEAKEVFD